MMLAMFVAAAASAEPGTCENVATSSSFSIFLLSIFALPTIIWLLAYSIPQLYMAFRPVPNLKKRYNATWALVTGGGSGIGKALAFKLASQGLNVVVVSLAEPVLKQTMKELEAAYPDLEFRSVPCTFTPGTKYMDKIKNATRDITVQIGQYNVLLTET